MGADIYFTGIPTRKNDDRYKLADDDWRGWLKTCEAEGYFRDSYNDTNMLHKFGLSWWTDITELGEPDNVLEKEQMQKLLRMLKENEPAFNSAIKNLNTDDKAYFKAKYASFKKLLNKTIAANGTMECSV